MKKTIYHEGLKAIAKKHGVSLEEALEIALQDLEKTRSIEHIKPTLKAYKDLVSGKVSN